MFSDSLFTMLYKENLDQYLLNAVTLLRYNPQHRLSPMIVQVLSNQLISDGNTNFVCKFRKPAKRGSIVRLVEWNLQLQSYLIVINDHQYLGGEGYSLIRNGQPWDVEKMKLISNSNVVTNSFVILYAPTFEDISCEKNDTKNVKDKGKCQCEGATNTDEKMKIINRNNSVSKTNNDDLLLNAFRGQLQKVYAPYFTLKSNVQQKEGFTTITSTNIRSSINGINTMIDSQCKQIGCECKCVQQSHSKRDNDNDNDDLLIQKLNNIQKLLKSSVDDEKRCQFENDRQTEHQNEEVGSSSIEEQQKQRKLVFTQFDIQKVKKQRVRNNKSQQMHSFLHNNNSIGVSQLSEESSVMIKYKCSSLTFDKSEIQKLLGKEE